MFEYKGDTVTLTCPSCDKTFDLGDVKKLVAIWGIRNVSYVCPKCHMVVRLYDWKDECNWLK